MNKRELMRDFNPSGTGLKNGNFIGLPFSYETANIILLPVPWDVTVSFHDGTALAPTAVLNASAQLDLMDPDIDDAWKLGIFMIPVNDGILDERNHLRVKASDYIEQLERGESTDSVGSSLVDEINRKCADLNSFVKQESKKIIKAGKICGIVGGDHSVPLGLIQALGDFHESFGVLQIDAHMDLRKSYQGFTWSHASVFYNVIKEKAVTRIVQVGIRDYCEEEAGVIKSEKGRVVVFYDHDIKEKEFNGVLWREQCETIINSLPDNVYISVDIDGLDPKLCPNTGTPVPGGIDFPALNYLLKSVVDAGKKIIGFDLCETGNNAWDANVAARIIYKLSNLAGRSHGLI
jgi:agmatinase